MLVEPREYFGDATEKNHHWCLKSRANIPSSEIEDDLPRTTLTLGLDRSKILRLHTRYVSRQG